MKSLKLITQTTGVIVTLFSTSVFAASTDMATMQQKINEIVWQNQQLTRKISEMEVQMQAMKSASAPKSREQQNLQNVNQSTQGNQDGEGLVSVVQDHLTISGAVEVEVGWSEDFEDGEESDIALATAEIALEAQVTDLGLGIIALEWDDDDKITIDEAFIDIGNIEKFPLHAQLGRLIVPFGLFDGNTISDPLTKEIFETKEDSILVGVELSGFQGSFYVGNGDTNSGGGDDRINLWGGNLGYNLENESLAFNVGLNYISSAFDADGLTEMVEGFQKNADEIEANYDPNTTYLNADEVGGVAAYAGLRIAGFVFLAEFITAVEKYETSYDVSGKMIRIESQPMAYHFEGGYSFSIGDYASLVSIAYSGSDDLLGFLPESRFAVDFGIELFEGVGLTFEYLYDQDYSESDSGTGESANALTVQLAYEF